MDNEILAAWRRTWRRGADRIAVIDAATSTSTTFRQLAVRAESWARLHGAGESLVRRTVVFGASNGAGWFEVFLGVLHAGGIAVPLDPGEPAASQRRTATEFGGAFWWDGEKLVALPNAKALRPGNACVIKLTSGSTGRPRPLWFTADQLIADAKQVMATMRIGAKDVNYGLIPFGHSYGLGNLVLPLLLRGIPIVVGESALPHAIAGDFARWKPTVFPGVPAMWRALAESAVEPAALQSLRLGISAGAPLAVESARAFRERFGKYLHAFYGSSETGGIAFDRSGRATLDGGVGRALRGVELKLRPSGQLQVCSEAVFTHGNPKLAKGRGCFVMPDRVQLDAQGELALLGRRDAVVKLAGRRVSLAEVQAHIRALSGVSDAWVGVSEAAEPVLGAAVASMRTVSELRAELGAKVAAWKVPRRWAAWPSLPLTARGKTDAAAIRSRLFAR